MSVGCGPLNPSDAFAILPLSESLSRRRSWRLGIALSIGTEAVHNIVRPGAIIIFSARPDHLTFPVLLIIEIFSVVSATIRPGENASSVHHVEVPVADKLSAISPGVVAETMNEVVVEIALVLGAIGPSEFALPVLLPIHVLSGIKSTVGPVLFTTSTLS